MYGPPLEGISTPPVKPFFEFHIHSDCHVSNIKVNTVVFCLSQNCFSSHFFLTPKSAHMLLGPRAPPAGGGGGAARGGRATPNLFAFLGVTKLWHVPLFFDCKNTTVLTLMLLT